MGAMRRISKGMKSMVALILLLFVMGCYSRVPVCYVSELDRDSSVIDSVNPNMRKYILWRIDESRGAESDLENSKEKR